MRKIVVMNVKGGCGKTTIATNIASLYAAHGYKTALIDHDPQGSSSGWLKRRSEPAAAIHGVDAYQRPGWATTRSWQMRIPQGIERVIADTPAAVKIQDVPNYLKDVDTIVVPVLSSVIDVEASAPFVHEVLRLVKMRAPQMNLVVVASRVRSRSPALRLMAEIFSDMGVTVAGHLRDSVNYIQCADLGLGVHDLPGSRAQLERRALADLVTAIDADFEQALLAGGVRQKVTNPMYSVEISLPHAAAGRYSFLWE